MGSSYSHLVFQPPSPATYGKELDGLIWFDATSERQVPGLYLQWQGREGERAYFTMLYSLGNTQDLGQCVTWLKLLMDTLHIDILCYDYTGYGLNEGKPSEQACFDDIYNAFLFLTLTRKIPADRILLYGKSLGSGPCIELASKIFSIHASKERSGTILSLRSGARKQTLPHVANLQHPLLDSQRALGGIILQSPMTSILNIERDKGNSGLLDTVTSLIANDMFENFKKVDNLGCPVFIIHGTDDEVIPFVHSKKLEPKIPILWKLLELPRGHHFDLETNFSDEILDSLIEFLEFLRPAEAEATQKKVFVPPAQFKSPTDVISAWLKHVGLEQYTQTFVLGGYFDIMAISSLTEVDLEAMEIEDVSHRARILEAVNDLQQSLAQQALQPAKKEPEKPVLSNLVVASKQTQISTVRLGKRLAKTFFSDFYVAEWRGKPVSVRSIKIREPIDAIATKLNALCSISHPNILPVLAVAVDHPPHVLLLEEWVSEGTLWEYIRKAEKIPLKVQVDFATEILVALSYLHHLTPAVAHRALSSKSVMLHEEGAGGIRVKLGEMGELTAPGLAWTAPELLCARSIEKIIPEKIDIYSFGVICWELATGKSPYPGQLCGAAAVRSFLNAEYRPTYFGAPAPAWSKVIDKCLHPIPDSRPSLSEIAELLTKIERENEEEISTLPEKAEEQHHGTNSVSSTILLGVEPEETMSASDKKKSYSTYGRQRSFFDKLKGKGSNAEVNALTLEGGYGAAPDRPSGVHSEIYDAEALPPKRERGMSTFAHFVPSFAKKALVNGDITPRTSSSLSSRSNSLPPPPVISVSVKPAPSSSPLSSSISAPSVRSEEEEKDREKDKGKGKEKEAKAWEGDPAKWVPAQRSSSSSAPSSSISSEDSPLGRRTKPATSSSSTGPVDNGLIPPSFEWTPPSHRGHRRSVSFAAVSVQRLVSIVSPSSSSGDRKEKDQQ